VIPAYQESDRIHWVVRGVLSHCADVVVVDDGSTDATSEQARQAGAVVLRHELKRGKGAALATGFHYVIEQGFTAAVTLDGNGRHSPSDIPALVEAHLRTGTHVIVGNRMGSEDSLPLVRRWTNRLATAILNHRMGGYIPDSQCGFRFYCCDVFQHVNVRSTGRSAESEMLLELSAHRYRVDSVPVEMSYGRDRSLLSPLRDALEFILMLRRQRRLHPRVRA
jgi:glycosyltransferase involved in cell wall biosynthesis